MKISRRSFLKSTGALALMASGCAHVSSRPRPILVNDVQSRLNPTYVNSVVSAESLPQLQRSIQQAANRGESISMCGGRHAMGAQQFLTNGILLDTRNMARVLDFNAADGTIEVEAGIQWPALVKYLLRKQTDESRMWTFAQKQTGADRFCIGGALGSNIHGRGLTMKPLISNIESFTLVDASGAIRHCSRTENRELFTLAIGGYGLFGVVYSVKLRLVPRRKLQRVVEVLNVEDAMPAFNRRIEDGFLYGDFQFAIDPASEDFLRRGVFSCYRPVSIDTPIAPRKKLSSRDWMQLIYGAHVDPSRAFAEYAKYYRSSSGNIYWSDLHQFTGYVDNFHDEVDRRMHAKHPASEIITEINVPRQSLPQFMAEAREDFWKNKVQIIYGTIRLIERDEESFLAWARESYACVILNVHTEHTESGVQHSAEAFRRLVDMAARYQGTYYLTYHKFASRRQVEACYPQFAEFMALKRKYDPNERFQSDWYRHYRQQA
ncbi:MAG: L-gulono,4-lactone dehydrogenase [Pedosphaera sp.]|nr:L-gulono,4-lactone dehydrogenase [Pedosphaera sp.]